VNLRVVAPEGGRQGAASPRLPRSTTSAEAQFHGELRHLAAGGPWATATTPARMTTPASSNRIGHNKNRPTPGAGRHPGSSRSARFSVSPHPAPGRVFNPWPPGPACRGFWPRPSLPRGFSSPAAGPASGSAARDRSGSAPLRCLWALLDDAHYLIRIILDRDQLQVPGRDVCHWPAPCHGSRTTGRTSTSCRPGRWGISLFSRSAPG